MSNSFGLLGDADAPKKQSQAKPAAAAKAPAAGKAAGDAAPRGGAGAARGGRGGPRAGNGTRPPKREFDRHSGTGRGKEVRKDGAGKGGWGADKEVAADGLVEATNPESAVVAEGEVKQDAPVVPEEPAAFVLEDYLKEKEKTSVAGDIKAPRAVVTNVELGKSLNAGKAAVAAKPKGEKKMNKKKNTLSLEEFNTAVAPVKKEKAPETQQSTGPRGGSAPRGGFRGGARGGAGPKINSHDFPALK